MHIKFILTSIVLFVHYTTCNDDWNYGVISSWHEHYAMCAAKDESPININPFIAIDDDSICTAAFNWTIDSSKQTFQIINNGHTVVLKPVEISNFDGLTVDEIVGRRRLNEHTISEENTISQNEITFLQLNENAIAKFPNYFSSDGSPHTKFCLDSFHFHWGQTDNYGSEHTVNEVHYPLEAHFVHYACDHVTLQTAMKPYKTENNVSAGIAHGDDVHVLGVVGLFFDVYENKTNPAFDNIFTDQTFEHIKLPDHDVNTIETAEIVRNLDLSQLIPSNIATEGYYAYEGSLTTPPCTNIVRWYVMNAHGYIGKSQLDKFRALESASGVSIAPNYRDIQSNPNNVFACIENESNTEKERENSVIKTSDKLSIFIYSAVGVGGLCTILILIIGMYCCLKRKTNRYEGMNVIEQQDADNIDIEVDDDRQLIQDY